VTLRGLIVGILVCLLVESLAFFGWYQTGRKLKFIPSYDSSYSPSYDSSYSPDTTIT
jgi:Na+/H+ antiporter NhaB